ncbi:metallophosphoesterase [bacterium]|nr:metallophosphoesterase [bacterium]
MFVSKEMKSTNQIFRKRTQIIISMMLLLTILFNPKPFPAQSKSLSSSTRVETETNFAVITDFGSCDEGQGWVAQLISYWAPEFVVSAGDNWQGSIMTGEGCSSYEAVIGDYYGLTAPSYSLTDFVSSGNFWPSPGNHDFEAPISQYLDYFDYIPTNSNGSKLYYDFVRGPVHFFMMDSIFSSISEQQAWLMQKLTESTSAWKIVVFHAAPYSGGVHGFNEDMQWDFAGMGADFVISGDNHIYERIEVDGIRYFNAGTGGGVPRSGDQIGEAYWGDSFGAMKVHATETSITFEYYSTDGYDAILRDTYTQSPSVPDSPILSTSHGTLTGFFNTQFSPSTSQTYQVSGENLLGDIQIQATPGYEISLDDISFSPALSLSQSGGSVADTTVYVRLNQAATGTTNGFITHTSDGANNVSVAVSGTTVEFASDWVAYNDSAWLNGQNETNITKYSIPGDTFLSSGLLVDHVTGTETPVTVTFTDSGNTYVELDPLYFGAASYIGTDAYNTFHGIVDMPGLISYGADAAWWVDLTFTGLDPEETYSFATSANRAGGLGGSPTPYPDRVTVFTLSGDNGASNASTSGTYAINDHSIAFPTGENTETGYVARWTNIQPSAEGTFTVRAEGYDSYQAYAFSVFMLAKEVGFYTLSVDDDDNGSVELNPGGGTYSAGTTVSLIPVPEPGYTFSHWSGTNAGEIIQNGADYTVVMDGDKAVTANFISADCTLLSLPAISDTYMRNGETRGDFNYGGDIRVRVNPYYESGSLNGQLTGALLKWQTPVIPEGVEITDINLEFIVTSTASNHAFGLYNMRRDWIEGTNDGAPGTGASWNYFDAGSTAWAAGGAADTDSDRYDVNLWNTTPADFASEGIYKIDLNGAGFDVIRGWADGSLENYGLTIQNYGGSSLDIWEIVSKEETGIGYFPATLNITYCEPTNQYTLQVAADPVVGGTTNPIIGEHTYAEDSLVTVTATANEAYEFDHWSGDCTGSAECQILMDNNHSVTAHFIQKPNLTITIDPENAGSTTPESGTHIYSIGSDVAITATANEGYQFDHWSGDCTGSEECQVLMDIDRNVTAHFVELHDLTILVDPENAGSTTPTIGTHTYADGSLVTVTADPEPGFEFAEWTGDCTGQTCELTIDSDKTVTANFSLILNGLSIIKIGSGTGKVTSDPTGIDCGETCSYEFNPDTTVTLTAVQNADSRFAGWSGGCSGTELTCQVTMDTAKSVSAEFIQQYELSVTKTGSGNGTVTSVPAGIDCGENCAQDFDLDTVVTLTVEASDGSRFGGWSGGCSGTDTLCQVTLNEATNVSAEFIQTHELAVTHTGSGSGTVTSVPAGIDCGDDCTYEYDLDTVVVLTAEADANSRFTGWSGEGCSGTGTCQVTMNAAKNVTADFISRYTLTIRIIGFGSVTDTAQGIDCSEEECTYEFDDGEVVTLAANPDPGSKFHDWSGAGCSGIGECVVSIDEDLLIIAFFLEEEKDCYILNFDHTGLGTNPIPTPPNSDGCAPGQFEQGELISLLAEPEEGYIVLSWSGTDDDSVTELTNTLVMPANHITVVGVNYGTQVFLPLLLGGK